MVDEKKTLGTDNKSDVKNDGPVNPRRIEDTPADAPEVQYDAHSQAVLNLEMMSSDTRSKLDIMLQNIGKTMDEFGSTKGDGSYFPYAPAKLGIGLNFRAGNYKTGEKDSEGKDIYKPHLALPAQVQFNDPNDWKKSISIGVRQLIKLQKYIENVLEANRPVVSYYVALEKEIEQRELDEDLGY